MKSQSPKNSLSIHLAESVVFLRPGNAGRRHEQGQFSILRGLLILDIVKPTRISSIEIKLHGRTRQIWDTEVAIGALNSKIVQDDEIFLASIVLFRASSGLSSRSDRIVPVPCRDKVPEQRRDSGVHTPILRFVEESPKRCMERPALGKLLKLGGVESRASGNGWKEFQQGTYTYPILFTIPCDSPPTLECEFGNVSWHLEAQAHRPGAFEPNLMAKSEVILIASPSEDDAGVTGNITVEREWNGQLQYSVYVSGRRFYPGAALSIHFAIVPLQEARIRRITVFLEEHAKYHWLTNLSNGDAPVRRYLLLCIQQHPRDKAKHPTLRHTSDDNNTDSHSPLYSMFTTNDEPPKLVSNLTGRGPWTFCHELGIPSCQTLHYTNENWRSRITITHALKIVMRMQVSSHDYIMGGQTRTQQVFDVVVNIPVRIHSCRCNPEWSALPKYAEHFETSYPEVPACPCGNSNRKSRSQQSVGIEERASAIPSSLWPQELFDRNTQFERLVSGQESEIGETPPPYDTSRPVSDNSSSQ